MIRASFTLREELFIWISVLVLFLLLFNHPLEAVEPDEILKDPNLEARARSLSADLRCLVCQNQTIDDSDAPLARDLRLLVRERLKAGDSDKEVIAYIVDRYGEFVLLRPALAPHTLVLWFGPFVLLLLAIFFIFRSHRRGAASSALPEQIKPLTDQEKERLDRLLDK